MQVTGITPILNVSNVVESVGWFGRLGWTCAFAYNHGGILGAGDLRNEQGEATFASVCAGEGQVFLCKDGQGLRGGKPARLDGDDDIGATWMSVWLKSPSDVDKAHALALANGISAIWPPTNEPWGVRECRLMHPDGHVLRISAPVAGHA
jgi:uncharacterized glyoxalase superfamily protein PhnB